ncbi:MAG: type II secretion system protein [Planctomycetes bacterium]|nr:type II secretion system protein [Planctomycetota bacterium]
MAQPADRPSLSRHRGPSGYTLVELLAVVLILGMLTVLAGPILVRRLQVDPVAAASEGLRQAQAEVRRLAVGSGARLSLRSDGLEWRGPAGLGVAYHCPDGVAVQWRGLAPALPMADLVIDARGRSGDVLVTISKGPARATWVISGLSGAWFAPAVGAAGTGPL